MSPEDRDLFERLERHYNGRYPEGMAELVDRLRAAEEALQEALQEWRTWMDSYGELDDDPPNHDDEAAYERCLAVLRSVGGNTP